MRDTHIPDWVNDLDLAARLGTPELARTGGDAKGPHALAISIGFEKLNLSGVLSIDQVPSVAFLELPQADETRVRNVHRALWNQGLVSVLIVCLKQEYRLYSVWESPMPVDGQRDGDRLLIEILRTARDAFRLRTLITEIESGRYFETHRPHFKTAARVDSTLLVNLEESEKLLASESLDQDSARAALLHVIFISYLEDRGILDDQYFADHLPEDGVYCLLDVLRLRSPAVLNKLFASLRRDFKGDVFKGPCSFGTTGGAKLAPQQIEVLSEFREGQIELPAGQRRFWPYDFSFIPVELISSIYDKFLNENDEDRRTYGSYYTPTFLADIVVEQATEVLELHRKQLRPTWVLDPACGSGIFLVRIFQRIVRTWRAQHAGRAPNWRSLTGFLKRIYGIDKQYSAIRIAALLFLTRAAGC